VGERDYAFEALAEVTGTDWVQGRGELNTALKAIREQSEVQDSYLLADLIHERGKMYREVMPDVMLTPPALAKHWRRVAEEAVRKNRPQSTNRHAQATGCTTCNGNRFVTVRLRPQEQTMWMKERRLVPHPTSFHEEVAPCPACHPVEVTYWRHDRTEFRSMDPAQVREAIQ
jgi:hypothetical protein